MDKLHLRRMVDIYFDAYRIEPTLAPHCREKLERDPFLFRIFCETYGDPQTLLKTTLPFLHDIYPDQLFRVYFDKRLNALADRRNEREGTLIRGKEQYFAALFTLVERMLQRNDFSSVPLAELDSTSIGVLGELVYEELLIRKDLKVEHGVVDQEVLAFSFDECRDFVIANFLVEIVMKRDEREFIESTHALLTKTHTVTEGVSRFLFFVAKRSGERRLYELVNDERWFVDTFPGSNLAVEDELVDPCDLEQIRERFFNDENVRTLIVLNLVLRCDENEFPNLNIRLVFELLMSLRDEEFQHVTEQAFRSHRFVPFARTEASVPVGRFARDVLKATASDDRRRFKNLVRLLFFLVCVPDDYARYPAKDALVGIFDNDFAFSCDVLREHLAESQRINQAYVLDLIAEVVAKHRRVPPGVEDYVRSIGGSVCDPRTYSTLLQYYEACQNIDKAFVPDDAPAEIATNRERVKKSSKTILIWQGDSSFVVAFDRHLTLNVVMERARARAGSYVCELASRICDSFFSSLKDIEEEYNCFYSSEYTCFQECVYWRYSVSESECARLLEGHCEARMIALGHFGSGGDSVISQLRLSEVSQSIWSVLLDIDSGHDGEIAGEWDED